MVEVVSAILPASGLATRMRGLPKFLLPCDVNYLSLIERHIQNLLNFCETIWIPVRPDLLPLVESLSLSSDRVILLSIQSSSMTETIRRVVQLSSSERFVMVMPDTYFSGELPYESLAQSESSLYLSCWEIRESQFGKLGQVKLGVLEKHTYPVLSSKDKDPTCRFPHSWGAMAFDADIMQMASDSMPHTGYLIGPAIAEGLAVRANVLDGKYFDCGTPSEYLEMLKLTTRSDDWGS